MTKSNFLPLSLTCSKETIECTLEPVHCKALNEKKYHSFGKIIDLRFRRKWGFFYPFFSFLNDPFCVLCN